METALRPGASRPDSAQFAVRPVAKAAFKSRPVLVSLVASLAGQVSASLRAH